MWHGQHLGPSGLHLMLSLDTPWVDEAWVVMVRDTAGFLRGVSIRNPLAILWAFLYTNCLLGYSHTPGGALEGVSAGVPQLSCEDLRGSLSLSEPQFPYLQTGSNNTWPTLNTQ